MDNSVIFYRYIFVFFKQQQQNPDFKFNLFQYIFSLYTVPT
jgi:hypothetical protein